LLASPRSLSQLATSFIAYLRQGIHTHALSSLTIKFTLDTKLTTTSAPRRIFSSRRVHHAAAVGDVIATCVAHQYSIVKELDFVFRSQDSAPLWIPTPGFCFCVLRCNLVGLGRIELPTSPLSGVRSSQLSYRPGHSKANWWSWSGSNRRPPECKSGALPAELQPLIRRPQVKNPRPEINYRGRLDAAGRRQADPAK
jgi:hypothetical protein